MLIYIGAPGLLILAVAFSACIYKRNYWAAWLGVILPPVAFVGALRLARPNSWWARRLYGEGEKMRRAEARHGHRVEGDAEKGWGFTADARPRWPQQHRARLRGLL